MFFKRWQRKSKEEETEETPVQELLDTSHLRGKKLPIITLDNSWHQLITEIKTPKVSAMEKELNRLLKEQGKLNTDFIEYTKLKKEMLDTILELTHEAFELGSQEAIKKIEDQQKMILKINENLEKIEPRLDQLPDEIQRINNELVDESVRLCYEYINTYKEKSYHLDQEIQVIRTKLMKQTEEKKVYDKKADQLYQYLHQLVGPSFIEKLDHVYWEQPE